MSASAADRPSDIPDLVFVSDDEPGWSRRRRGKGFSYYREDGSLIKDKRIRERLNALAIPPAWREVWICPLANGHLLSTGRDEKDRKQYRYHPEWTNYRQLNKFHQLVQFATVLPAARKLIRGILTDEQRGWDRERLAALALALMDETGIRVGNSSYARRNGTVGLTTLRRKHLEVQGRGLHFAYPGKSHQEREIDLRDRRLVKLVREVSELPGYEVFRYRGEDGKMHNLKSGDINRLVRELIGPDFSSKFFRTWVGTSEAVYAYWHLPKQLTNDPEANLQGRVVEAVAEELGNTPAVCRQYYIHPLVLTAIGERAVPDPDTITEKEREVFAGEFDDEEIIAYRIAGVDLQLTADDR